MSARLRRRLASPRFIALVADKRRILDLEEEVDTLKARVAEREKRIKTITKADRVVVERPLLMRLIATGRDGYGHAKTTKGSGCDGCDALVEAEELLARRPLRRKR